MNRIRRYLRRAGALALLLILLGSAGALPCAAADAADTSAAGAAEVIEEAPVTLEEFLRAPAAAVRHLLADKLRQPLREMIRGYARLAAYLLLCAAVALLLPGREWQPLLELLACGGSFLLLAAALAGLAQETAAQSGALRDFLALSIPLFVGIAAAGGQTAAASVYSGFFLTGITFLAQVLYRFLLPVTQGYLAVAGAGALSGSPEISDACESAGRLLKRAVFWAGTVFVALLGLQRAFSAGT